MNYRRVMRIPSFRTVTVPLAGVVLVLAGCAAQESAPPAPAGPCAIVANGTPAPKTSAAAPPAEFAHHLPQHLHQSRGRHRLPQGHDRRAHRALRGRHGQSAGHPDGLRGAQGRRNGRRRGWSPRRRCWGWSSRRPPGSAAAGSCSTTTPSRTPCRPTTAGRSPRRRPPRTTCAGSPTPTAPSPNPTPGRPAAPSACPASCGC